MAQIKSSTIIAVAGAAAGTYVLLSVTGKLDAIQEALKKSTGGGSSSFSVPELMDLSFIGDMFSTLASKVPVQYDLSSLTDFSGFTSLGTDFFDNLKNNIDNLVPEIPDLNNLLPDLNNLLPDISLPKITLPASQEVGSGVSKAILNFFLGLGYGAAQFGAEQRQVTINAYGKAPEQIISDFLKNFRVTSGADVSPGSGGQGIVDKIGNSLGNIIVPVVNTIANIPQAAGGGSSRRKPTNVSPAISFPGAGTAKNITENITNTLKQIKEAPIVAPAF